MPFIDVNNLPGDDHARIAIAGPEGSGKTLTGLKIMRGIVGPRGRIAVIDTENRSSRKFRAYEHFFVSPIDDNYAPAVYVAAIREAERGKFDGLVIDSLTHAWNAPGGALDQIDAFTGGDMSKNRNAWRKVTPEHNRLVEALVHSKCNLLCTLRVKTDMEEVVLPDGRKRWQKVGLMPIQRDGMMYEFDMVLDMDVNSVMTVSKSRVPQFNKNVMFEERMERGKRPAPTLETLDKHLKEAEWFGAQVAEWLRTGIGKSRAQMVTEAIIERATATDRMDETLAMMLEAAGDDITSLDQIMENLEVHDR